MKITKETLERIIAEEKEKMGIDKNKADLDKDGKLSGYEIARSKAISKAMNKNKTVKDSAVEEVVGDPRDKSWYDEKNAGLEDEPPFSRAQAERSRFLKPEEIQQLRDRWQKTKAAYASHIQKTGEAPRSQVISSIERTDKVIAKGSLQGYEKQNIESSIDYVGAFSKPLSNLQESKTKITKEYLRNLIKEELKNLKKEGYKKNKEPEYLRKAREEEEDAELGIKSKGGDDDGDKLSNISLKGAGPKKHRED